MLRHLFANASQSGINQPSTYNSSSSEEGRAWPSSNPSSSSPNRHQYARELPRHKGTSKLRSHVATRPVPPRQDSSLNITETSVCDSISRTSSCSSHVSASESQYDTSNDSSPTEYTGPDFFFDTGATSSFWPKHNSARFLKTVFPPSAWHQLHMHRPHRRAMQGDPQCRTLKRLRQEPRLRLSTTRSQKLQRELHL